MPSYDYICRNDHVTEFSYDTMAEAKQLRKCPKCGLNAEKQIAMANPILGLQGGTFKGEQHQQEVRKAMEDFSKGKNSNKEGK